MNKQEMLYKRLSPNEIIDGIDGLIKDRQSFLSKDEETNKVFLKDINLLNNVKENLYGLAKESANFKSEVEYLQSQVDKAIKLIEKLRMEKWSIMGTDIMDLLSILEGDEE